MRLLSHAQEQLDRARKKYQRAWNRGYLEQQMGDYDKGQRILEKANREYAEAKRVYEATTGRRAA